MLTSLAFIWSTNYKEQSKLLADNITLPWLRPSFDQEGTTDQLVAQIAQGDYSSIQGKWASERGVNYEIDGSRFLFGKREYYMIKGGYDNYGIPYIMTDNRHSAKLYFYPAGKPIPTLQEDGTVVVSDIADPSDTSKNRLLFAQTVLPSEQIKENVFHQKIKPLRLNFFTLNPVKTSRNKLLDSLRVFFIKKKKKSIKKLSFLS